MILTLQFRKWIVKRGFEIYIYHITFPSISQKQVFNCLNQHFEDKDLSLKISKLCTFKKKLPQGAPTSPMLSNIVFKEIDEKITHHCNSKLIVYTRYADDLTFSSNNKTSLVEIYPFLEDLLNQHSFYLNKTKTQYLSGKGRMSVTGININEGRLTIGRTIKRRLRSCLYKIIIEQDKSINVNMVMGYLSYIRDIEPEYHKKIQIYIEGLKTEQRLKRLGFGKRHGS
ncbi:MAG: RNA-directed DNA polymerase [Cytophagia bacterium]|nr:RNA-directed DNA polymerase [Cytophagia bacterium]